MQKALIKMYMQPYPIILHCTARIKFVRIWLAVEANNISCLDIWSAYRNTCAQGDLCFLFKADKFRYKFNDYLIKANAHYW